MHIGGALCRSLSVLHFSLFISPLILSLFLLLLLPVLHLYLVFLSSVSNLLPSLLTPILLFEHLCSALCHLLSLHLLLLPLHFVAFITFFSTSQLSATFFCDFIFLSLPVFFFLFSNLPPPLNVSYVSPYSELLSL